MNKIKKGILSNLLGQMSPGERKLVLILGLLENAKIPTRAERDIQAGLRERPDRRFEDMEASDIKVRKALVLLSKRSNNEIIDAVAKMNSLGLTKQQMLEAVNKLRKRQNLNKIAEPAISDMTNKPDSQKFAIFTCDTCDFTIDATQDLEDQDLVCARCGGDMIGITREEWQNKSRDTGFNEGTELFDPAKDDKGKTPKVDRDAGM